MLGVRIRVSSMCYLITCYFFHQASSLSVTSVRTGAGLRLGEAYGVFYLPGFVLAVPVPYLLGTQPPFTT